jgi:hypothetical protein
LIALLIVLLIREPKEDAPNDSRSGPTEDVQVVESEISSKEAEKAALQSALEVYEQFESDFKNKEIRDLATELANRMSVKMQLEQTVADLSKSSRKADSDAREVKSQQEAISDQLKQNSAELVRLSDELKKEQSLRTRTMSLPKEKETSKSEVPAFVKDGQLFFANSNRSGLRFQLNTAHFETCPAGQADIFVDSKYLRTRKGQGFDMSFATISNGIGRYDSSRHYFAFVVRSDSFSKFETIRDACVKSGFEYRLIPTNGMVSESSGVNAKTQ